MGGSEPDSEQGGSVSVLSSPFRVLLVFSGQMDGSLNAELADAVTKAQQQGLPVDVDTRAVTFMDSSVIAMVAYLVYRLPHRVRFIQPPQLVRFLLEVTNIGELVDVLDHDPGFPDPDGPAPDVA